MGWIALPVLVAGALALLWWSFRSPPRLQVSDRGILDRSLGLGWIPWNEIEGAYPPSLGSSETVRLKLRVSERLARILKRKRRRSPDPARQVLKTLEVRIDLAGTEINPIEILQRILVHEAVAEPAGSQSDRRTSS